MIFDPPLHRIFIIKLLHRSYREEEGAVLKPRRDINDSIIESIVPWRGIGKYLALARRKKYEIEENRDDNKYLPFSSGSTHTVYLMGTLGRDIFDWIRCERLHPSSRRDL